MSGAFSSLMRAREGLRPGSALFDRKVNLMFQQEAPEPICSAKGCRRAAEWVLAWNNPKIHPPERRKTWLACSDHREHLSTFLDIRGFLRDVVPFHPETD